MKIQFIHRDRKPDNLLSDVELELSDPPGIKIVGIALWRGKEAGQIGVTFPSRKSGEGSDAKYYDFVRGIESAAAIKDLKRRIIEAWESEQEPAKEEGQIGVTFPSRKSGEGSDAKYYDYVRSTEGASAIKALKSKIIEAWESEQEPAEEPGPFVPSDEDLPFGG